MGFNPLYSYWCWNCPILGHWELLWVGPLLILTEHAVVDLSFVMRSISCLYCSLPAPDLCVLSCFTPVWLFAIPWTVAHQAPLSMGFSRQERYSGLPRCHPGDLPDAGTKPASPALAGGFFTTEPAGKPSLGYILLKDVHLNSVFWSHWNNPRCGYAEGQILLIHLLHFKTFKDYTFLS